MEKEEIEKIKAEWKKLTQLLAAQFDEEPDLQVILFLIGVQELGKGAVKYSKDEKQNLMHIATCAVLSEFGYYELEHTDNEGWPHYKLIKALPKMPLGEQDLMLRQAVIRYFEKKGMLN
jgi:hypothetical protein